MSASAYWGQWIAGAEGSENFVGMGELVAYFSAK